jgi:two-component system, NtrC family, sensor histidine kinase KinB
MAYTVKQRIRWGTLFLFVLLLLSGGVGIFYLVRLKNDAKLILKDNYESLDYSHSMTRILDSTATVISMNRFDSLLTMQENNLTEAGEQEATTIIRRNFNEYRNGNASDSIKRNIAAGIQRILAVNMSAIEMKNTRAQKTADNALTYISIIAAIIFLVGFTFAFNFPSVLTVPIGALTQGIQQISNKKYDHRIHLDRKDEFGQMAESFNEMAGRLEYFENSNLNKILFEKARAEAVINSLQEASIGIDKNDIVLFANNQALQLLGLLSGDIVGKPVGEVAKRNDLLRFLLEEKGSVPFKIVVEGKENYFTKEILNISQDNSNSKVIVLRNITSFKELDVAKTNFIATISHELKTPLASSDFSLKLLEDERVGNLSAEQKELVQTLRNDNQRMLRILSELLNLAQVEAGKIQMNISDVNPVIIADAAIDVVTSMAKEKDIRIQRNYADDIGLIKADAEKTGWVVNNFLTNAVKHAPNGSTIDISIRQKNNTIEVSVTDEGPGIPSQYLSKVFERFFKVPGSKVGGTGLGLAISKEFIESEGGTIWVKSEVGMGSVFGFSLPLVMPVS